ncbi:MAG: response regulator [[Clostridium] leptum]
MYKLLIVDDEKQVREGLKRLLPWQDYGITIIGEAINGREALGIIEDQRPDIVLLDIQMPVMNGLELAKRITPISRMQIYSVKRLQ